MSAGEKAVYLLAYRFHRHIRRMREQRWGGRNRRCPERGLCKKAVLMPQAEEPGQSSARKREPL